MRAFTYAILSLMILPLTPANDARAFGPDLCFMTSGELANCTPLPPDCLPGDDSLACQEGIAALSGEVSDATATVGAKRSMVHMDFTFFAAQFVGFTRDQAYYIGAYDDATDLGRYVPRGINGELLADPETCDSGIDGGRCRWVTRALYGLNKVNILTGGLFFHFHAPYNDHSEGLVEGINGIHPDTDAPTTEPFISHLRRWADPSNGVDLLCAHGLTDNDSGIANDYAYGNTCYGAREHRVKHRINGALNIREEALAQPLYLPYSVPTGPQIINFSADGTSVDSRDFDRYIGKAARWARIGIFLHAYQDRLSHYRCLDASYFTGPGEQAENAFFENMKSGQCDQRLHVVRHAWETGAPQQSLAPEDRTLEAGLQGTFEELLKIAVNMGIAKNRALDPVASAAFIQDMLTALQVTDPTARMRGVSQMATGTYGLYPLPGF